MAIYKITYSKRYKRANLYNYGCNYKCIGCSYKLKPQEYHTKSLSLNRIKEVLSNLDIVRVHFLGGEPSVNVDLPILLEFTHNELGCYTMLGHTCGSNLPLKNLDGARVSIKAYSNDIHKNFTGKSNINILHNFRKAYNAGMDMEASSIFIPGLVENEEIKKIVEFVANVDSRIPYHIIGYVPVPGAPWRKPTNEEIMEAVDVAKEYLSKVTWSNLTAAQFLSLESNDVRYESVRVA